MASNQKKTSRIKLIVSFFLFGFFLVFILYCFLPLYPPIFYSSQEIQDNSLSPEDQRALKILKFDPKTATAAENYQFYCAYCHGRDGRANTSIGERMLVRPTDLVSGPFRYSSVSMIVKNGVGSMPGFSNVLAEEDINSLAIYVLSLRKRGAHEHHHHTAPPPEDMIDE